MRMQSMSVKHTEKVGWVWGNEFEQSEWGQQMKGKTNHHDDDNEYNDDSDN